jgi:hypothetical protein
MPVLIMKDWKVGVLVHGLFNNATSSTVIKFSDRGNKVQCLV